MVTNNPTTNGWILFVVVLGATLVLIGQEVSALQNWDAAWTPAFVGKALFHMGTVIGAFFAGKQIPTQA